MKVRRWLFLDKDLYPKRGMCQWCFDGSCLTSKLYLFNFLGFLSFSAWFSVYRFVLLTYVHMVVNWHGHRPFSIKIIFYHSLFESHEMAFYFYWLCSLVLASSFRECRMPHTINTKPWPAFILDVTYYHHYSPVYENYS